MARLLEFAGTPWLEKRLAGARALATQRGPFDPGDFDELRVLIDEPFFKSDRFIDRDGAVLGRALHNLSYLEWATLEHLAGTPADRVRAIYRELADSWLPVIREMDFAPRRFAPPGWCTPSTVREKLQHFDGEVIERRGQYARVRYTAIPQPFSIRIGRVYLAAAMSGDSELAQTVARSYQVRPPHQLIARFERRETMLRHLLANDDQAESLANQLDHGYRADVPPPRIEFLLGVLHRDSSLLQEGMRRINSRFRGMWDYTRIVERFERFKLKPPLANWVSPDTDLEGWLDIARDQLLGGGWFIAEWAVALLNVATWRGLSPEYESLSQWIPRELLKPSGGG